MYLTYKYRIKDSSSAAILNKMAQSVNYVWNYCNEWSHQSIVNKNKFLSKFDLNRLTGGCSKHLGIAQQTIQAVAEEYSTRRRLLKRNKLNWRTKKSLGWIPFKDYKKLEKGNFYYYGYYFRFWESRPVNDDAKTGSFNQDSKGRWYLNLCCKVENEILYKKTGKSIGVDLGVKTAATYSDGCVYEGVKPTKLYANKLAKAQRARKKRQFTTIHAKIKNTRKDSIQKETTRLVKEYDLIVVGDVSPMKIQKTKMAKGATDAAWCMYKTLLAYKTFRFGKELKVVNENWTSKTCSSCTERTGPSGLSNLSVREWTCSSCGQTHDRDVNAAKNILRIGHDTPIKGNSQSIESERMPIATTWRDQLKVKINEKNRQNRSQE